MENGGGFFATGDHANLGSPLCGLIPRVRSMRRWWTGAPPPGFNPAPSPLGRTELILPGLGSTEWAVRRPVGRGPATDLSCVLWRRPHRPPRLPGYPLSSAPALVLARRRRWSTCPTTCTKAPARCRQSCHPHIHRSAPPRCANIRTTCRPGQATPCRSLPRSSRPARSCRASPRRRFDPAIRAARSGYRRHLRRHRRVGRPARRQGPRRRRCDLAPLLQHQSHG